MSRPDERHPVHKDSTIKQTAERTDDGSATTCSGAADDGKCNESAIQRAGRAHIQRNLAALIELSKW